MSAAFPWPRPMSRWHTRRRQPPEAPKKAPGCSSFLPHRTLRPCLTAHLTGPMHLPATCLHLPPPAAVRGVRVAHEVQGQPQGGGAAPGGGRTGRGGCNEKGPALHLCPALYQLPVSLPVRVPLRVFLCARPCPGVGPAPHSSPSRISLTPRTLTFHNPLPSPILPSPQAWDLYYHVFKRINKQLHSITTLELQYVSPALVRAQVRSRGRGRGRDWVGGKRLECVRGHCGVITIHAAGCLSVGSTSAPSWCGRRIRGRGCMGRWGKSMRRECLPYRVWRPGFCGDEADRCSSCCKGSTVLHLSSTWCVRPRAWSLRLPLHLHP